MANPAQITLRVTPGLDGLQEQYLLSDKQVRQIGSGAINRTLPAVRTRATRRLAEEINLRQKDIRDQISIKPASEAKLEGSVTVSRKPVPLIDFIGTRETRDGVSVQLRRGGRREVLKGTFIARMKSGHEGVFERRYKAGRNVFEGPRFGRLPIEERFGLTLTGYLSHAQTVLDELKANAGDLLANAIANQVSRRLAEKRPTP